MQTLKYSPLEAARLAVKAILFYGIALGDRNRYLRIRRRSAAFLGEIGIYERQSLTILSQFVSPGDTVLDIGANYGIYTAALAKLVGEKGRVMAFEPNPALLAGLEQQFRALPNVEIQPFGLSNDAQQSILRLPLLFGQIPEPALATVEESSLHYEELKIELRPLDDFINKLGRLTFIKVDIEGHEEAFFKGARAVIEKYRPVIQFESMTPPLQGIFYKEFCDSYNYILNVSKGQKLSQLDGADPRNYLNYYLVPTRKTI